MSTMDHELRHGVDQMLDDMRRLDRDTTFILNQLYGRSRDMRVETELARDNDVNLERQLRTLKASIEFKYKDLARRLNDNAARLDAVLAHLQIPDPLQLRARQQIMDMTRLIRDRDSDQPGSPALLDDFFDVLVHIYPEIDSGTLEEWVHEAIAGTGESEAIADNNNAE